MIEINTFGKSFGPVGSSAGVMIMVIGICAAFFYSLSALILVVFGAFVGLTNSSTTIDFGNQSDRINPSDRAKRSEHPNPSDRSKRSDGYVKRVKNALNLFGIIPIGKWITVEADMKIGIKKSNLTWRTYSKSNRAFDIKENSFVVAVFDSKNRLIAPLKQVSTLDQANADVATLCQKLKLSSL